VESICDLTITEARRAFAKGDFGPVDLVTACLGRIDSTESVLRAWVTVDREGALHQAGALRKSDQAEQPLWGIPVGVKDIIDVEGLPTTASSRVLEDNMASDDAPVVQSLRAAGAVILGKTNTQEFAYGCVTPPTTNPWDPARIPGGSSGGSAAALAASQCLATLGSDTAGSIRIPAALCGITGLKPRPGLVSLEGVIPLAPSFDVAGPMARTVEDVAILWDALVASRHASKKLKAFRPRDGFKLAIAHVDALPDLHGETKDVYDIAVEVLRSLASKVTTEKIPRISDFDSPRSTVLMVEALEVHRSRGWWPALAEDYSEETRSYLQFAERNYRKGDADGKYFNFDPYPDYLTSLERCRELAAGLTAFLDNSDVLVTPTVPRPAPTHEEARVVEREGPRRPVVRELTRIPGPVNVAGLAALSIPCGFTSRGLPVGLQLIGSDENLLLAVGAAYQRETDWTSRRPPLAKS
jgi:aspartyl-tRNA(Asn)/glutamyl-tRNA(Gln) amidotransferase subunit A